MAEKAKRLRTAALVITLAISIIAFVQAPTPGNGFIVTQCVADLAGLLSRKKP